MSKLKTLSGREVVDILKSFKFETASQRGSHIKIVRILPDASRQTLTIPLHDELDKGTLRAIYRQALRYIGEDELKSRFYTE